MKLNFILIFDLIYFLGFLTLFLGDTNQKFFRNDAIGFGVLFFLVYFLYTVKSKRHSFYSYFHLLFVILLSNYVFFKLAEYDPIQLLPEKLAIKLMMVFWNIFILHQHHYFSEIDFKKFGSILAIIPCFVTSNFITFPVIPIGIALGLCFRNHNLKDSNLSLQWIVFFGFLIFWFLRDWSDDFAINRVILFSEVALLYLFLRNSHQKIKLKLIDSVLILFFLNSLILVSKMFLDSEFRVDTYKEDLYLIPVSLIGSNAFLILALTVISFRQNNNIRNAFYLMVLFFASLLLLLSVSRISIISVCFFVIYYVWSQRKSRLTRLFYGIFAFAFSFFIIYIGYTEKSFLSIGTLGIRLSIWKLHILTTFNDAIFTGFGFHSEKVIPFASLNEFPFYDFALVKEYIIHFNTYPLAHNLYFQILSATGILGFSLFVIWITSLFFHNIRNFQKTSKRSRLVFLILLIWLIHESMDFSSLEIANVFILCLLFVDLGNIGEKTNLENRNYMRLLVSSCTVLFFLTLFLFSLRFSYIEQLTFRFHKNIQLSTFYEFKPSSEFQDQSIQDKINLNTGDYEVQFFGERYFFLKHTLAYRTKFELNQFNQCFQHISRKELCYANLLSYIERLDDKNKVKYKSAIQILLASTDPFGIYSKDFL
ncbi:O-antigen ligase family protein [Leptospira yanagawae]|uniref:O-antigen ligase family protein n=1 Tax=Leptospira yanagawae TaxID=293069 RepID=A0ABY2LWR7_9LEPT|nr:O-antigen ligase family protein [Leptospira yanagawae]TGL16486.1 O-antigen ligase family protein [Leptospira yanagawae]